MAGSTLGEQVSQIVELINQGKTEGDRVSIVVWGPIQENRIFNEYRRMYPDRPLQTQMELLRLFALGAMFGGVWLLIAWIGR